MKQTMLPIYCKHLDFGSSRAFVIASFFQKEKILRLLKATENAKVAEMA